MITQSNSVNNKDNVSKDKDVKELRKKNKGQETNVIENQERTADEKSKVRNLVISINKI